MIQQVQAERRMRPGSTVSIRSRGCDLWPHFVWPGPEDDEHQRL